MPQNKYFEEFVDPFEKGSFIIRAEHYIRYIFARDYVKKYLPAGSVIYDIGCGNGYGSEILAESGYNVLGFDRSEELLSMAKKRQDSNTKFYNIDFETTDLAAFAKENNLSLPNAVVCFEILEHIESPNKLLQQIHELVTPNGMIILSVPNAQFEPKKKGKPRNIYHKHLFMKDDLEKTLLDNGYHSLEWYGQPFTNSLLHMSKKLVRVFDFLSNTSLFFFTRLAALVAFPKKNKIETSYSFIVIARK